MTEMKLARTPADYRKCHALMRATNSEFQGCKLSFPTVMAYRGDELVGFLSSRPSRDGLIAEPIVMNVEGNASFLYLKLAEAYESLLKAGKVPSYFFHVPAKHEANRKVIEKTGLNPVYEDETGAWFRRWLV